MILYRRQVVKTVVVFYLFFLVRTGNAQPIPGDWLIDNAGFKAAIECSDNGKELIMSNGLVKRVFRLHPNVACTGYENLSNGQQLLRAVKPEAVVVIDGKKLSVGGLYGQKEQAYLLPEWVDSFTANENDFQFKSFSVSELKPYINWKKSFWARNTKPLGGKVVKMIYASSALPGVEIAVHYELYDGIPLIVKWISITNGSGRSITVNRVVNEVLALVEEESAVVGTPEQMKKQHGIYIETNYAFNNSMRYDISDQTTHWQTDSLYTSQVNYNYQTPCLLEVYPEKVSEVAVNPGEVFTSVRTHQLLLDSYDRERRGLSIRRMYAVVAPWTTQNPLFMHLVSRNDEEVKSAIEQCSETGYEALILSFGSHCNLEDTTTANIVRWKALADYAHQKGIRIGGYSLFSSRRISDEHDVIDPVTGKPDAAAFFGHAPCFGSQWGLSYAEKLKYFLSETGFDIFENDGPYPGDVCASTVHPGHKNLGDSQWRQMEMQKGLYRWCCEQGIYVNAPDWYFLDGSNKIALGYREVNFSLSREQQKILNRQNIFDGTWEKTPSMGWGFVPLTRYHGGGEDAILEPLEQHLDDYKQLMMQYYGAGVQACYRGPRLYDTEKTKKVVVETLTWYKQYRDILNADLIHLRRADGRDWDGFLHVAPDQVHKGMLMLFNPLSEPITRTLRVPVYYTGLHKKVRLTDDAGKENVLPVSRDYCIELKTTIPAKSYRWYLMQ